MEQTFGSFVRQRRQAIGISLRGLATRAELSPVYMSSIETNRKAAPAQETLERLAMELRLIRKPFWTWPQNPGNNGSRRIC